MRRFLLAGTILVTGIVSADWTDLSTAIVANEDFPAGNFWTAWSEWYGCSESTKYGVVTKPDISTKQEFCSFPGHTQLLSVRYRECVLEDNFKYPNQISTPGTKESRYNNFVNVENAGRSYDSLNFMNTAPASGNPNGATFLDMIYSNGNLGVSATTDQSLSCEYTSKEEGGKGLREHCQAASTNVRCDPRLQKYADDNNARGNVNEDGNEMTVDDVFNLLVMDQNSEVRAAIPEPYLTYQVQEAICPSNCPVPLPWTSWSCHCDQGSAAIDNDVDSVTETDERNPDNLPACDCGRVKRKRYQLCYDEDTTDDVTCESLGMSMATTYPGLCAIDDENSSMNWYRSWYEGTSSNYWLNQQETNDWTRTSRPFDDQTTNWYGLGTWVNSRNQDTPWRKFDVTVDSEIVGASGIVNFLSNQFNSGINVDEDGGAVEDEDLIVNQLNDLFRESVVNTWAQDSAFPAASETFDVIAQVLNRFYNTYPKYNLVNGARNGCNFKGNDAANYFDGFFSGLESDFTFEKFEKKFQSCVWESYFRNYETYQTLNVEYLGIVRAVDTRRFDDNDVVLSGHNIADEVFDHADFKFIQQFAKELFDSFNPTFEITDVDQDFPIYNVHELWGFDHTVADFDVKVAFLRTMWNAQGRFQFDLRDDIIVVGAGEVADTDRTDRWTEIHADYFATDATEESMEAMLNFMAESMRQSFIEILNTHTYMDAEDVEQFGWSDGWSLETETTLETWRAAFNTLESRREFTNSIINLIIDPAQQYFEISVPAFMAKLQARGFIINLSSPTLPERYGSTETGWNRRWMADGGHVQDEYTQFGMYNMTAVMWMEQQRIREANIDLEMERMNGWARYNIHPEHSWTDDDTHSTDRPHNKLEYNYNENVWYLNFRDGSDDTGGDRAGYTDLANSGRDYDLVRLTGAYPDACWPGAGTGEYVVPFAFNYESYEMFQVRYQLAFDDNVMRIYHEDMSMRQSMLRFIRNRFTSNEVGYQEDMCISTTGALGDWAEWGGCSVECGTGIQTRNKRCFTGEENEADRREIIFDVETQGWVPLDLTRWTTTYDATCQCEPGEFEEERTCFAGCTYDEWTNWRADDNGATCFLTGDWEWATNGGSAPPSCVSAGENNIGSRFRTRNNDCGDPETCCDMLHEEDCSIPICSGWKEWGSWSQCSVSCGVDRVGTKMRTRDCYGMGTDVGVTPECPCHATFAIDQCQFGGDELELNGNGVDGGTCINHYTNNNWNVGNNHDAADPGYMQISKCSGAAPENTVAPFWRECPYLRRNTDDDNLFWTEWTGCSATCGTGYQRRRRECLPVPAGLDEAGLDLAQNGYLGHVAGCRGGDVRELRYCNDHLCPSLNHWEEWGECSHPCGDEGERSRARSCHNFVTGEDMTGEECVGYTDQLSQTEDCRRVPCPHLSEWSVATECTAACRERNGYTKSVRHCMYGDEFQEGCDCIDGVCPDGEGLVKYEDCNTDIGCPIWGQWNQWSQCIEDIEENDVTFNGHRRFRFCYDPQNPENAIVTGQRECEEGDNVEYVLCDSTECPIE